MENLIERTENGGAEPLHNRETMNQLLNHFDKQEDLANHLSISSPTIVYWKKQHDFDVAEPKNGVYFREHKGDGHFQIRVRNDTVVPEHALAALAAGSDPHNVFGENSHIHHLNGCSYDNRPENVIPVTNKFHQLIHQNEQWASKNGLLKLDRNMEN